jgi:hypothetical protein
MGCAPGAKSRFWTTNHQNRGGAAPIAPGLLVNRRSGFDRAFSNPTWSD